MLTVLLSLTACLGWGLADYLAALKSRSLPIIFVLVIPQAIGLFAIIPFLLYNMSSWPPIDTLIFGFLAGCFAIIGMASLYRGMAIGPIGLVSLITSMCAVIPILFDLIMGNWLSLMQTIGIIFVLISIILLRGKTAEANFKKPKASGIGFGFLAALAIGILYILMDAASNSDPYWASMVERTTMTALLVAGFAIKKPAYKIQKSDLPVLAVIGVLNSLSVVAFAVATTMGMISIVSVVVSLYPIVPIFLAAVLLHERLTRNQTIGVVLALSGIIMVSAGS